MAAELLRVRVQLDALLKANIAAPLYRLPISMTAHTLPKLIGDGVLDDNEVYTLIEWVNRIEELNRGLDRAGAAHAAKDEAGARDEYSRNRAKAEEIRDEILERHGGVALLDAAQDVLFSLVPEKGGGMKRLVRLVRKWLNALGLTLGIAGVAIVWYWGLPQPSFQQGVFLAVSGGPTVQQHDSEMKALETRYRLMAKIGFSLIIAGFGCQLLNEVLPRVSAGKTAEE